MYIVKNIYILWKKIISNDKQIPEHSHLFTWQVIMGAVLSHFPFDSDLVWWIGVVLSNISHSLLLWLAGHAAIMSITRRELTDLSGCACIVGAQKKVP